MLLAAGIFPALAAGQWRAGVANVDITPQESIWLAGYGNRTKPSEGVLQKIHAKALVLEDQTGSKKFLCLNCLTALLRDCLTTLRVVGVES